MKKHQTFAIVLIIILAIVVAVIIFASKKSTEPQIVTAPVIENTPIVTPEPATEPQDPAPAEVATFTLAEVATHNSRTSCYTIVSGNVYDVSTWIGQHPGGQFPILGMCGKDATSSFTATHGGQARPESELASFKIGTLVQ